MIALFIRITLAALAICFAGWVAYIVYLGLKTFFKAGSPALTEEDVKEIDDCK